MDRPLLAFSLWLFSPPSIFFSMYPRNSRRVFLENRLWTCVVVWRAGVPVNTFFVSSSEEAVRIFYFPSLVEK